MGDRISTSDLLEHLQLTVPHFAVRKSRYVLLVFWRYLVTFELHSGQWIAARMRGPGHARAPAAVEVRKFVTSLEAGIVLAELWPAEDEVAAQILNGRLPADEVARHARDCADKLEKVTRALHLEDAQPVPLFGAAKAIHQEWEGQS